MPNTPADAPRGVRADPDGGRADFSQANRDGTVTTQNTHHKKRGARIRGAHTHQAHGGGGSDIDRYTTNEKHGRWVRGDVDLKTAGQTGAEHEVVDTHSNDSGALWTQLGDFTPYPEADFHAKMLHSEADINAATDDARALLHNLPGSRKGLTAAQLRTIANAGPEDGFTPQQVAAARFLLTPGSDGKTPFEKSKAGHKFYPHDADRGRRALRARFSARKGNPKTEGLTRKDLKNASFSNAQIDDIFLYYGSDVGGETQVLLEDFEQLLADGHIFTIDGDDNDDGGGGVLSTSRPAGSEDEFSANSIALRELWGGGGDTLDGTTFMDEMLTGTEAEKTDILNLVVGENDDVSQQSAWDALDAGLIELVEVGDGGGAQRKLQITNVGKQVAAIMAAEDDGDGLITRKDLAQCGLENRADYGFLVTAFGADDTLDATELAQAIREGVLEVTNLESDPPTVAFTRKGRAQQQI